MFGGERKRVSIRFRNYLLDTAIERFGTGKDVFYRPDGNEHFVVTADVEISDQFFAWVCGFGKRVKIIAPNETISMIKDFVCNIKSLYDRIAELVISLADILLWAIHRDGVLEHPMLIC